MDIISFHSRVNRAEAFTTDIKNIMAWISDEHRPSGTPRTGFVSGNMPANKRKIKLDQLKALSAKVGNSPSSCELENLHRRMRVFDTIII